MGDSVVSRYGLAILLFPIVTSCAAQPVQHDNKAEQSAATQALLECLDAAAIKADDHRSDAATIGFTIIGMCGKEFTALDEAYFRGESYAVRQNLERKAWETRLRLATRMVLAERTRAQDSR